MSAPEQNVVLVVLAAGILAAIAVAAVTIVRLCLAPVCPICGGRKVEESGVDELECQLCGQRWNDQPKRFGRCGGVDL